MLTKSTCQSCGGHLEFDVEDTGKKLNARIASKPPCSAPIPSQPANTRRAAAPAGQRNVQSRSESQSSKKTCATGLDIALRFFSSSVAEWSLTDALAILRNL